MKSLMKISFMTALASLSITLVTPNRSQAALGAVLTAASPALGIPLMVLAGAGTVACVVTVNDSDSAKLANQNSILGYVDAELGTGLKDLGIIVLGGLILDDNSQPIPQFNALASPQGDAQTAYNGEISMINALAQQISYEAEQTPANAAQTVPALWKQYGPAQLSAQAYAGLQGVSGQIATALNQSSVK